MGCVSSKDQCFTTLTHQKFEDLSNACDSQNQNGGDCGSRKCSNCPRERPYRVMNVCVLIHFRFKLYRCTTITLVNIKKSKVDDPSRGWRKVSLFCSYFFTYAENDDGSGVSSELTLRPSGFGLSLKQTFGTSPSEELWYKETVSLWINIYTEDFCYVYGFEFPVFLLLDWLPYHG